MLTQCQWCKYLCNFYYMPCIGSLNLSCYRCCKYILSYHLYSLQFSCSVMSKSLQSHGLQHSRPPYPSPAPGAYSNSCPLSWWYIQSSHPLSSPSPPTFNLSQHQGLFQWISSSHQVTKILERQIQHQFFQWIFRTDFL